MPFLMNPFWDSPAGIDLLDAQNITTTGITQYNFSLDLTGASAALDVVLAISTAFTNQQISSVVIDPSGVNRSCSRVVRSSTGNDFDTSEIWQPNTPWTTDGTFTVRVTTSGNANGMRCAAYGLLNVLSTTAAATGRQGSNNSTSASCTADVTAGSVALAVCSKTGTSDIVWAGTPVEESEGQYDSGSSKRQSSAGFQFAAAAVGQSFSASWTTSNNGRMAVAVWR